MAGTGTALRPAALTTPKSAQCHCHFDLGHPYWHDPMGFLSPAHYMLNILCSTRHAGFQELLIQLLLFDHSNNEARRKSFSGGQAHSFPSVPMVLLLLSDTTKVLHFRGQSVVNCNLLSAPVLEGHHSQYKFCKAKGIYQHALAVQDLAVCCSFPQESLWSHHHHCSPGHPTSHSRALLFPRCTFCMASGIK